MLRRIKKVFKRGTKCKQCRDYDRCFEGQAEYNHYNTLNAPACVWFERCEEIEDIEALPIEED